MIEAVLNGKSLGYEYMEDFLTSTVFGTLKHVRPDIALIPFLESAFLYDFKRTTLREKLSSEGIDLRHFREVEYEFWVNSEKYGEPDLILIFKEHIHGHENLILVIEAKFKSKKSGKADKDQLARYFQAIENNIESFSSPSVSNFKGNKGFIIYLTEAEAFREIETSLNVIQKNHAIIEEKIFHLRWHQMHNTLEKMCKYAYSFEKSMLQDLKNYMVRLGLKDFSGISELKDKSLISAMASISSVFYDYKDGFDDNNKYFDNMKEVNYEVDNKIFYKEIYND